MTRIVVISDTHARSLDVLPPELLAELTETDLVVHCGDYTSIHLLAELHQRAKRFIGVYGNMDPKEIRDELPDKTVVEVEGIRIGVIHPFWGGPPWGIEEDIAREFDQVDLIIFGHTHDVCNRNIGGVVFLNPGQAYPSFRTPASAGVITIEQGGMKVEVKTFG
jgi:putative phosphoesterase